MKRELIIKKCPKCNAIIKVIEDCNCHDCGIECCGEKMIKLIPNTTEASHEKHLPTYEIKDSKIIVKVNHVMESDHFIEWISLVTDNEEKTIYLNHKDKPEATFCYKENAVLYAYCNKHGLWKTEIK